jgi:DNA primase
LEAAKRLSEFSPADIASHKANFIKTSKTVVRDTAAICEVIQKLQTAQTELHDEVRKYLLKRGIRKSTAKEAMEKGLLLSLPSEPVLATKYLLRHVGRPLLEKAGMWKKDAKLPTIAYRPLGFVSVGAEAVEFRVIEKSENNFAKALRYGPSALWKLSGDEDTYMITEGCIDMLSAREFKIERTLVALPGAKNWQPEWLEMFRNKAVLIALDTDETGKSAQKELIKKLEAVNATVVEYPIPAEVKDLNDWLLYDNLTSKI